MIARSLVRTLATFTTFASLMTALFAALLLSGCSSTAKYDEFIELAKKSANPGPLLLQEGDQIKVTFPGAPDLNTTLIIRRDGKISLPQVGEVTAAGMTTADLEKQLSRLYSNYLLNKEVLVSLQASSFPVFVTGAVLRPGRVNSDRPISVLEAIMEAGGFDYTKANLKKVRVIRESKGRIENITVNLMRVLQGAESQPYYVKPHDIIFVPEKFSWF